MRTMRIITIVCWVVTALVLAGLAAWFLTGTLFGIRINGRDSERRFTGINIGRLENFTGPFELAGSYDVGTAGLDSINIEWAAGTITVKPHDGADVRVSEYAQRELRSDEKLTLDTSGSMLTIRYRERGVTGSMPAKRLEVLIPRVLCGSLSSFSIDSASGGANISDMNADVFKINTMSGNIDVTNLTALTVDLESSSGTKTLSSVNAVNIVLHSLSGNLRVTDSYAETFSCEASSGTINISGGFERLTIKSMSGNVNVDNLAHGSILRVESTSGRQDLSGAFSEVEIKSMSGSVSIKSSIVPSSLTIESSSGGITIAVPDEGEVRVKHSATSGRLTSDIPIVIVQGGAAQFNITSMSGSTRIIAY